MSGPKRNSKLNLNPFADYIVKEAIPKKEVIANDLFENKNTPSSLDDFVGNKKQKNEMKKWLKSGFSNSLGLFIYGPSGCGKHTLVRLILEGYSVIEISNSTYSEKSVLFDKINKIISSNNIIDSINGKKSKTAIIFSDVENIFGDGVYWTRLLNLLSETFQKQNKVIPVVFISKSKKIKKRYNTPSKLTIIELEYPSQELTQQFFEKVVKKENLKINPKHWNYIIAYSKGDYRKIFHTIKLLLLGKKEKSTKEITKKEITKVLTFSETDAIYSAWEILDEAINEKSCSSLDNMDKLINYCYPDQQNITELFFSNITAAEDLSKILEINDSLCQADILQKKLYDNQEWGTRQYTIIESCIKPMYITSNRKSKKKILIKNNAMMNFPLTCFKNRSIFDGIKTNSKLPKMNPIDTTFAFEHILYKLYNDSGDCKQEAIINLITNGIYYSEFIKLKKFIDNKFSKSKVKEFTQKEKKLIEKTFNDILQDTFKVSNNKKLN